MRWETALAAALSFPAAIGCRAEDQDYFGTTERKGKDVGTYYVNNSTEPEYMDPGKCNDTGSSMLASQMFEGLTVYAPTEDMHPTQGVATSWDQSKDNRLFRFHLRADAKWSDGKPVTAHDFEYAWKRVLRPSTASLAQGNLYPLMNGELFASGKLQVTKEAIAMAAGPEAGAPKVADLAKGAAVVILGSSPQTVKTAVTPFATVRVARNAQLSPEELSFDDGKPAAKPAGAGWKDAVVDVVAVGPKVQCNGQGDHWFEVRKGADRGFLPGCALGAAKSDHPLVLVRQHHLLPTYVEHDVPPEAGEGEPTGFLPPSALVEDDSVLGVRAVDDRTLEVELGQPAPYFIDLTAFPTLAPVRKDVVEAFEKRGEPELWTRPENIVVNGPYTLDTWTFRYEIRLKQNPRYWNKDALKIHEIVVLEVEESHAGMNLYKAGDIDFFGDNASLASEYQPFLVQKKDYYRYWFLSTYWFDFNTRVSPTNDVRVRRALNLAVDKKQIVEHITQGGQMPATHYVPDFTGLGYADQAKADKAAGTDPFTGPEVEFNPPRARELLAEAGYPVEKVGDGWKARGFPGLEILYNTNEGHKQIAVAVQDMWKRNLGITVNLRNEEWKVMLKNIRDGHFQVARFGWTADYNHPNTWLDTFVSTSPENYVGWVSQEYDEALHRASATADPKESIKRYREAEKIAVDAMPRLPLYFYTRSTLAKPWLKGFHGLPRGAHLAQFLWIDPDHWQTSPNEPAHPPLEFAPPGPFTRGP